MSVTTLLNACRPAIGFVALLFGVMAAFKGMLEVVPLLGQVFQIPLKGVGSAQVMAVTAGALALVANINLPNGGR